MKWIEKWNEIKWNDKVRNEMLEMTMSKWKVRNDSVRNDINVRNDIIVFIFPYKIWSVNSDHWH